MEIECQQELGTEGLLEEDSFLAECNLGDLEDTSGKKETCWLLAIQATWEASRLEGKQNQTTEAAQEPPYRGHTLKQQLYGCIAICTRVKVLEGE